MHIAIIGAGQVGQALARAFRRAGHSVVFGVREAEADGAERRAIAAAVAGADLSILAVPFNAAGGILADPVFAGRIVVDATNPLAMGEHGLGLTTGHVSSGAEQIAAAAPHARVVKAFNQTGFENMADAAGYRAPPVMFVASDDAEATRRVMDLAEDVGFEAIDAGPLRQARLLEPLAMLWIELARKRGQGANFAFHLQRRGTE